MKNILESIKIESEYIGKAAWRPFSSFRSDKWECCIYRGEAKISIEFHIGEGCEGREPELKEVIYALLNDSQAGELSFEDFCSEFCYNPDSRRAFATWEECVKTREKLGILFSPEDIEQLGVEFSEY